MILRIRLEIYQIMSKFKNKEFEIMQDTWKAYTKYYEGADPDNDAFWESCTKEFVDIIGKYKTQFATEIADAFLFDIERRSRNGI